jgi:four helix bundle protein
MGTIKTFKDLEAWKGSIELAKFVYLLTRKSVFIKDPILQNQIRRPVISIASNIAEGFEREGKKELIQYLTISKGSAAEVQTQLQITFEIGYITLEEQKKGDVLCTKVIQLISGFLRYLHSTNMKGNKYKHT